jgi:hypothetical protein
MILQYKKHVSLLVNLEIGEKVTTTFSLNEAKKIRTIEDIKLYTHCESGVMVRLTGLDKPVDSGWVEKLDQTELNFTGEL